MTIATKSLIKDLQELGLSSWSIKELRKVAKNIHRKDEHACNGYHSDRAASLAETYVAKQLKIAKEIVSYMNHPVTIEHQEDPRGVSLKLHGLPAKFWNAWDDTLAIF